MSKSKVYEILSSLNELKWRITLKGIVSGLIAGLLTVFYRLGIEYGTETAIKVYSFLRVHPVTIFLWVTISVLVGLFIAWLVKHEPMASGSGIPQVEGIILYGFKMKWYSILFVRFVGGILSSFFGVSLGREGPSIQIGASGSQAIAKKLSKNKLEENYLITGGAAAGLSAAFNAPLSGIVFVLEEVHKSFSPLILIAATTASLTADVVSKYFFGLKPVLNFVETPQLPGILYLWLLPIGILSGVMGALTNRALLKAQMIYKRLPSIICPVIALAIAIPCGLFLPQILGGGQNLILIAEKANVSIIMLSIFLLFKILFTCTSFGSGIPGGIFMPILSIGALTGSLMGVIAVQLGIPSEFIADFCVCAMAGVLSGSVKAPITSILLMAEMTGSLVHLLPVAACSFIALLISDLLKVDPIYEVLLERITNRNVDTIKNDKSGAILEIPVEVGSVVSGKRISEIEWPEGSLIVSIHRGNKEIVPNGNTIITNGDYLVVLSTEARYDDMNVSLGKLCRTQCGLEVL